MTISTAILAEEMHRLDLFESSNNQQPRRVWGVGQHDSPGNEAVSELVAETTTNLKIAIEKDQERLQYTLSERIRHLEQFIRKYRQLCAYHIEIKHKPAEESSVWEFYMQIGCTVNVEVQTLKSLWKTNFELGL